MTLIALTGSPGSGKDTVAGMLAGWGYTRIALADPLRDALYRLNPYVDGAGRVAALVDFAGWDRAKRAYPEVRALLQRLGTEVVRELVGADFWVELALRRAREVGGDVVITDCRFANEALAIWEAGGLIYRINRPGYGKVNDHASEAGIPDHFVRGNIDNSATLDYLSRQINAIISSRSLAA